MEFTASNGRVVPEFKILKELNFTIEGLKTKRGSVILCWEKEFLEWFLNKSIECRKAEFNCYYIYLHKDITEDELKQLEQFTNFLKL